MFYAQLVLAKKGALGKVWLAAHWDRKLTKTQINSTDISKSVDSIMNPVAPFALRLTAHLLLGVVRIYSRKVRYLLSDCTDALTKIKMAFRPGMVDLPADANVAAINSITLPEHAADIDLNIPFADDITLEPCGEEVAPINTALWGKITLQSVRPVSPPRETDIDPLDAEFDDDEIFSKSAEKMREGQSYGGTPITPSTPFQGDIGGDFPIDVGFGTTDFETPTSVPVTPGSAFGGDSIRRTPFTDEMPLGVEDFIDRIGGTPVVPVAQPRPDKRPRVAVDVNTELSSRFIKEQLKNTGPITREMILAPVTKKALLRKEREQQVHTLYRITNIEGLAPELLDLFALSMVDGPRDVPTPDKIRKELDLSPGTTPVAPLQGMEDEEMPLTPPGIDVDIPQTSSRPPSPTGDTSYIDYRGDEGEDIPPPEYVEESEEPWSERTKKMHAYLDKTFGDDQTNISYLGLVKGKKVHTVAGTFFELLVLKSRNLIDLDQEEPYADILIQKTAHFYDPQQ